MRVRDLRLFDESSVPTMLGTEIQDLAKETAKNFIVKFPYVDFMDLEGAIVGEIHEEFAYQRLIYQKIYQSEHNE